MAAGLAGRRHRGAAVPGAGVAGEAEPAAVCGRVSIAGVVCYRPGDRPHLFYQLLVYRRRKARPRASAGRITGT